MLATFSISLFSSSIKLTYGWKQTPANQAIESYSQMKVLSDISIRLVSP